MLDGTADASLPEDDPFRSFGFGRSSVAHTTTGSIRLLILNAARETAVIQADAGAGIVILDTLAAGDSIRLKLESRADSIQLRALRLSGALLGSEWVRQGTEEQRAVFP